MISLAPFSTILYYPLVIIIIPILFLVLLNGNFCTSFILSLIFSYFIPHLSKNCNIAISVLLPYSCGFNIAELLAAVA